MRAGETACEAGEPTEATVVDVLVSQFAEDPFFYRHEAKIYESGRALI